MGYYVDVAVEIVSPRSTEPPGPVPVIVRLTNLGDLPGMVPRLDVIRPDGWADYRENISLPVGDSMDLHCGTWDYDGGVDTCWAWITFPPPGDSNHANDTDVVIVNPAGIQDRVESQPPAGISLTLLPSPFVGNVLHIEYSLTHAGPASVTLFDIRGRAVATRSFVADRSGELPMDLRRLSGGVYLARLDDGHRSVVQKFVVQR
jgi:hypothetical protein